MKRLSHIARLLILAGLFTGVAVAQDSLAEAARQQKKQKEAQPSAKREVFTNDNLPREGTVSTVGAPASGPDAAAANAADAAPSGDPAASQDGKAAGAKPLDEAKQREKGWEEWRDKIGKQKTAIEQLVKENEQMETDFRVRSNAFYSSAQNRIYDGAAEARAETEAKDKMAQKKKSLDDAKQKLEDMQEEARRAGVPSGYRD